MAVAGRVLRLEYSTTDQMLRMVVTLRGRPGAGETIVHVPAHMSDAAVEVTGAARLVASIGTPKANMSRLVRVTPLRNASTSTYHVVISRKG